jgi:N utilization substance protein B
MVLQRKSSILAFQALYAWDLQKLMDYPVEIERILSFSWNKEAKLSDIGEEITTFARLLVAGCVENKAEIDETIKGKLKNWDFARLNAVDRAILRFGTYLLVFQKEFSPALVIGETLQLCEEFSGGKSAGFVNGVLDAILKELGSGEWGVGSGK